MKVIVILPAGKLFDELFAEGILPVLEELELHPQRLSPQISSRPVLLELQSEIRAADLSIMDLTASNPNMLYLLGYARALDKQALLSTMRVEDFPFDRTLDEPIVHAGDGQVLRNQLKIRLSDFLAAPETGINTSLPDARRAHHESARVEFESIFGKIMQKHQQQHRGPVYKENETTFVLEEQDLDLALVQELARKARSLKLRLKLM